MPDAATIPVWAADALRQFPVVVLLGFVAWYAFRHIREQHADHLTRMEKRSAEHLESKDTEIRRLMKAHADELKRVREAKDAETRRLTEQLAGVQQERDRLLARILEEGEEP